MSPGGQVWPGASQGGLAEGTPLFLLVLLGLPTVGPGLHRARRRGSHSSARSSHAPAIRALVTGLICQRSALNP